MYFGYIYKTTNNINGKVYIGQSAKSLFNPAYFGSGKLLKQAIKKYGIENFSVEVLTWCSSRDELNTEEIRYISQYLENSYNLAKGGTGGDTLHSSCEEIKAECFKKRSDGIKRWHGSLSEDEKTLYRKKISDAKKGKSNGLSGRKQSRETVEKRNATLRANGWSEYQREQHSKAMAKRRGTFVPHNSKTVKLNGIIFKSIGEAAAHLGISPYMLMKGFNNGTIELEFL